MLNKFLKKYGININLPSGPLEGINQKKRRSGAKVFKGASKKQKKELINGLTVGAGKPVEKDGPKGGKIDTYTKPDGTIITVRTESNSNHGNINIDILKPNKNKPGDYIKEGKIKFIE